MRRRIRVVVATCLLTVAGIGCWAGSAWAAAGHQHAGLPDVDLREPDARRVAPARQRARDALERSLAPAGEVRVQPRSARIAWVHGGGDLLTAPSARTPEQVALGYLRTNNAIYGLSEQDIENLVLVARSTSPDGITHLRYNQTLRGIPSFDSGISAHVTADGRLVAISGSPLPGAALDDDAPGSTARQGLVGARANVGGSMLVPAVARVEPGAERATSFSTGEHASLRWTPGPDGPRLVWWVIADGADRHMYDVLVDAADGDLLRRQSLAAHVGEARYFPGDPASTPGHELITMPAEWYDQHAGGTRLWGQYARTYTDPSSQNPAAGAEEGGARVQIAASNGAPDAPEWRHAPQTGPGVFDGCPTIFCTWNGIQRATAEVNQLQAGTNVHVLTSRFAEHLAAAPIGFDEASGNFQRVNHTGHGLGGDYVRAEVNDGADVNNANFFTPPDGQAPRMQMFLTTGRAVNTADDASIVYHEYGHGLSHRLVVNAGGAHTLVSLQPRMMGEAWSDFYALDLLVHEGVHADTPAPAELTLGSYSFGPGGVRAKPIDCPVNPTGVDGCNGHHGTGQVLGGYTYGDLAVTSNSWPHNGGEIWGQTLWDIRSHPEIGRHDALALITGGMRLSPSDPSMLDMRDAILLQAVAMRSDAGAPDDHYARLWHIFAARGMGAQASTPDANATIAVHEDFTAPSHGLRAIETTVSDPYPGGDSDGIAEPGEVVRIHQAVQGVATVDQTGVSGTLASDDPALAVIDGDSLWPTLGKGRIGLNTSPFTVRLPSSCTADVPVTIAITGDNGDSLTLTHTFALHPGMRGEFSVGGEDPLNATHAVTGAGTVTDLDVRIEELRHTWLGDLKIEIVHVASGTTATLVQYPGNGPDGWDGDDMVDVVFDSQATEALPATNAGLTARFGSGPITGRLQPHPTPGALDAFTGLPLAGEWTLRIGDRYPTADGGTLHGWGIDAPGQECPRAEIPSAAAPSADQITPTTAILRGSVTPNGRDTGLRFAWGTTSSLGSATAVQDVGGGNGPVTRTATLTGLQPATTYHVRVEAIREGGQVATTGATRTFTTGAQPADPPPPGDGGQPPTDPGPTLPGTPVGDTPPPATGPRAAPPPSGIAAARVLVTRHLRTVRSRATLRLVTDGPGRATIRLSRNAPGIRRGRACVAVPRTRPAGARPCVRQVTVGRPLVRNLARAGAQSIPLSANGLAAGRYTAVVALASRGATRTRTVRFIVPSRAPLRPVSRTPG